MIKKRKAHNSTLNVGKGFDRTKQKPLKRTAMKPGKRLRPISKKAWSEFKALRDYVLDVQSDWFSEKGSFTGKTYYCFASNEFYPKSEMSADHIWTRASHPELRKSLMNLQPMSKIRNEFKFNIQENGVDHRPKEFVDYYEKRVAKDFDEINGKYYKK